MKLQSALFFLLITATQKCAKQKNAPVTLNVRDRVALLKYQISRNIRSNISTSMILPIDHSDFSASSEYVDIEKRPITPIMDYDDRKKHGKYRLRELITTTEMTSETAKTVIPKKKKKIMRVKKSKPIVADDLSSSKENEAPTLDGIDKYFTENTNKSLRIKTSPKKPVDIFYRRIFPHYIKKKSAIALVHCQDLITPIMTGQKTNLTHHKLQSANDRDVSRLIQLFNEDTQGMSKEEIYSIMYQISNLQIRLFRWDLASIKLLFNVISSKSVIPVKRHTFRSLKHGIKRLFDMWSLDISNVTNLMKQARLFRPPCIKVDDHEGSTKASQAPRFATKKEIKPTCPPKMRNNDGSCDY